MIGDIIRFAGSRTTFVAATALFCVAKTALKPKIKTPVAEERAFARATFATWKEWICYFAEIADQYQEWFSHFAPIDNCINI